MYKGRRSQIFAAAFTFLLALSVMVAAPGAIAATPQGSVQFALRSLDGATVTPETNRGRVVVLAFGATWLPLSKAQLQGLKQLADQYGAKGVTVYWVSTDSDSPKSKNYASDEQIRAFVNKANVQVTVLRDPDGAVSRQLGVDQLPAIVILDKSGAVAGKIGGLDPNRSLVDQLGPKLDQLLK
jgi:peroxiredoxin